MFGNVPKALILASLAAGVAAVHQGISGVVCVARGSAFCWFAIIYFLWGMLVLYGVVSRRKLAWMIGTTFAAAVGGMSALFAALALLICGVTFFSKGSADAAGWLADIHRFVFCAAYLLVTYYLLQRPESVAYFGRDGRNGKENESGTETSEICKPS